MDGVFLINKQRGCTSFDICAKLRKRMETKKVGHAGTLDPFAEGVMLVALGKATKILPFLEPLDKTYIARLQLGVETDTQDCTGTIIREESVPALNPDIIASALQRFLGKQKQIPPMYSALKRNGVPLYALARNGIEVERKARDITVFDLQLLEWDNSSVLFSATVSKGTYIRTLGSDIASKLGTCGHLSSLIRTRIGGFDLSACKCAEEVKSEDLLPVSAILSFLPKVYVDDVQKPKVANGMRMRFDAHGTVLVMDEKDRPLAIYEEERDGSFCCKRGLL